MVVAILLVGALALSVSAEETTAVQQWNIVLGDDIGANFYLRVPDHTAASVKISVDDQIQTVDLSKQSPNTEGLYKVSVNVAAAQMTEDITLQLVVDGTEYAPGTKIEITAETAVTAVWEVITYTVSFNANDGSSAMEPVVVTEGTEYTLSECTFTAPVGKQFKAWNVNGEEMKVGDNITITADTEIAAVWKVKSGGSYGDTASGQSVVVQSPDTFDTGIAIYGAMAVLAATGSAVIFKKRR